MADDDGNVKGLSTGMCEFMGICNLLNFHAVRVEWTKDSGGRWKMEEVPGSERFFPAQLVFLALGFLGPESSLIQSLALKTDPRSNIQTPQQVSVYGLIFAK